MTTTNETCGDRVRSIGIVAGLRLISNILFPGQTIPLHVHEDPHLMLVPSGHVRVTEHAPDGTVTVFDMAAVDLGVSTSTGYRREMPAFHHHEITCIGEGSGEVLCIFPAMLGDHAEGC